MHKVIIIVLALFLIYFILRFFAERQSKHLLLRKYKDAMLAMEKLRVLKFKLSLKDFLIVMDDSFGSEKDLWDIPKSMSMKYFFNCIIEKDRRRILEGYRKIIQGDIEQFSVDFGFVPAPQKDTMWCHGIFFVRDRNLRKEPVNLMGIVRIINDYKEEIDALIKEKQEKEKENMIQSEFITNMDYEIRTPLNAIMGFSDLLSEMDDEKQRQSCISVIKANNEALLRSVNNLLDFYRMQSPSVILEECDMDVNKKLKELQERFSPQLSPDVSLYFNEQIPDCVIMIDARRFDRAMSILIDNAIKNTTHGNICVGYHETLGNMLYFYVSDTGNGIELDKQRHLFSTEGFSENKHQGLGLLLFKAIVQKMSGGLGVKSQFGVGSEFWFTVPYKKV